MTATTDLPQTIPSPSYSMRARVGPTQPGVVVASPTRHRWYPVSIRLSLLSLLNLGTWLLLTGLLFGQIFGVVLTSVTTYGHTFYGQPIEQGLYDIPGLNDEPYTDRAVVCIQTGRIYQPIQLSQLIAQQQQKPQPDPQSYPTNGRDAYRVVTRDSFTMDATKLYTSHCNAIASTITEIFSACEELGYNVTKDVLRVVDGVQSEDVVAIPKTLPVLILPYWDATIYARYVIPSYDGSGCMFRTSGMFEDMTDPTAVLWGVSRVVRENKTATWLGYPGGVWRHGWYEDPVVHMKWYSDVISTEQNSSFGVVARRFDLLNGSIEIGCDGGSASCMGTVWRYRWNDELTADFITPWYHSVAISNGSRFGLFLYSDVFSLTMKSRYSVERLISNASLAVLLARWMVLMVALYPDDTIGVAALANSFSFHLLPLLLLPRLRSSLEGFWTAGCMYDGDQTAMENAWFTMYPAIGEVVLVYFSVLNLVAKLFRRRMSDTLFGPTLLFFVLLHRCRENLATAKLFDGDARATGIVSAEEVNTASVLDYFTTDLAFRVGGKVTTIFSTKLVMLALNLVPLVLTSRGVVDTPRGDNNNQCLMIEHAVAIRFESTGGLGSGASSIHQARRGPVIRPYELVRAGYIVIGSESTTSQLISVIDWCMLLGSTLIHRSMTVPIRVLVFDIESEGRVPVAKSGKGDYTVCMEPRLVGVGGLSALQTNVLRISAREFG